MAKLKLKLKLNENKNSFHVDPSRIFVDSATGKRYQIQPGQGLVEITSSDSGNPTGDNNPPTNTSQTAPQEGGNGNTTGGGSGDTFKDQPVAHRLSDKEIADLINTVRNDIDALIEGINKKLDDPSHHIDPKNIDGLRGPIYGDRKDLLDLLRKLEKVKSDLLTGADELDVDVFNYDPKKNQEGFGQAMNRFGKSYDPNDRGEDPFEDAATVNGHPSVLKDDFGKVVGSVIEKFARELPLQSTRWDSSYSRIDPEARFRGYISPQDYRREQFQDQKHTLAVYFDASGSWNSGMIEKAKRALSTLTDYSDPDDPQAPLEVRYRYLYMGEVIDQNPFVTGFRFTTSNGSTYTNIDGTGAGSTPLQPIIDDLLKYKPTNVMIVTDSDFDASDYLSNPDDYVPDDAYVTDGYVWLYFVHSISEALPKKVHSTDPEKTIQMFTES